MQEFYITIRASYDGSIRYTNSETNYRVPVLNNKSTTRSMGQPH